MASLVLGESAKTAHDQAKAMQHGAGLPPGERSLAFTSVFLVGFIVLLAVACVGQVLFLPWRSWLPGAECGGSLVASVRASVYTFMSFLN
jgi:light-harvesting complex 1 beta chain